MILFGYKEQLDLLTCPLHSYVDELKWRKLACSIITNSENTTLMNFQRNEFWKKQECQDIVLHSVICSMNMISVNVAVSWIEVIEP